MAIRIGEELLTRSLICKGGMTVALNDVVLLRDLLSPENIPSFTEFDLVLQQLDAFHWGRKRYCTAINVLAMALYRLFAAEKGKSIVLSGQQT